MMLQMLVLPLNVSNPACVTWKQRLSHNFLLICGMSCSSNPISIPISHFVKNGSSNLTNHLTLNLSVALFFFYLRSRIGHLCLGQFTYRQLWCTLPPDTPTPTLLPSLSALINLYITWSLHCWQTIREYLNEPYSHPLSPWTLDELFTQVDCSLFFFVFFLSLNGAETKQKETS